jgi:hypothetical protein
VLSILFCSMSKISGNRHVLTRTDGACTDRRVYLQKRENVKECTGGGPVGEPPMLKSNTCYLERNINSESIEVRKECVIDFSGVVAYLARGHPAVYSWIFIPVVHAGIVVIRV